MPIPAEQTEQRKRKRQSDPAYTLACYLLYRIDGLIRLESYREFPQMSNSMGCSILDLAKKSIPDLRTSRRVLSPAQRNLVKHPHLQYLRVVSCLQEFKSIFTQVVRCHRALYVKTGSLHGNLSPNSFLFMRNDDGVPLGCLVDWDSAKPIFAHEASTRPAVSLHAGGAAFLAIELLREEPPTHLYRHDLESFMYILIWCALHLNLNGSEVPGISDPVTAWTYGTRDSIQDAKLSLFSSEVRSRSKILGSITPAFLPIRRWVKGLIRMFNASQQARMTRNYSLDSDADEEVAGAWDEDTLSGTVTYEKFMDAIGEKPHIARLGGEDR